MGMKPADSAVELEALIRLFYDNVHDLGMFTEIAAEDLPQPQRALLAHDHHMTVSIEGHHLSPVNVLVLATRQHDDFYSRKILLKLQSTDAVVQFGIVRLNLSILAEDVRQAILDQNIPLGRILIKHNVMREVKLINTYRVDASRELACLFELTDPVPLYGRTALIYCNGIPAVELLEIVGNCRATPAQGIAAT